MTDVILSSDLKTRPRALEGPFASDGLRAVPKRMAEILSANGMCIRITFDNQSFLIGHEAGPQGVPVEFVFASEQVFVQLFQRMRLANFATAFFNGDLQINGPISKAVDALDAVNLSTDHRQTVTELLGRLLVRSLKVFIPSYAKRFESLEHYSQSETAYELFLDDYMQYTCGHFKTGNEDINEAQVAKFQLIEQLVSKHIGTLSGKNHLDIGCGWGGMSAYFRKHVGMHSIGNTNCSRQMAYAQSRFETEIVYGDFTELRKSGKLFELITIVGMIEHLTPYRRSQLLNVVSHVLSPGGIVYLQCIVKPDAWIGGDAYRIAKRDIFPGHFLETAGQTESRLQRHGFTILEKFEHHRDYALTTARWIANIQKNEAQLVDILGTRGYRMYLGYLAYASKLFLSEGRGSLMRYVLTKRA